MGQKRSRLQRFDRDIDRIAEFVAAYQRHLRTLLDTVASRPYIITLQPFAVAGRAEIWPCTDAAVVLIFEHLGRDTTVEVREPVSKTAAEFLRASSATEMLELDGRRSLARINIDRGYEGSITWAAPFVLGRRDGSYVRTRFDKLGIIAWDATLPDPRDVALEAFQSDFAARNVVAETLSYGTDPATVSRPDQAATKLLQQYRELLGTTTHEEDVQQFIAKHPAILYPDYLQSFPKFKLGAEYVTDFVVLIQSHQGPEYVFVEIERPGKPVFARNGQFSAAFTQAKDQLLDWEQWLSANHAYVSNTLKGCTSHSFTS